MATVERNPKDSMKSTWRTADRSQWNFAHWFYELFNLHLVDLETPVPIHDKSDKMPYVPELAMHRWILTHAAVPVAIQQIYCMYTGHNLTPLATLILYSAAFKFNAIRQLKSMRSMGHQVGFLDGDEHDRDGIPDVGVIKVFLSLIYTSISRPVFTVLLSYRAAVAPQDINWAWLPFEIGFYSIILDFWFYWYHRLMHDVSFLWKYHRTHHLTKHPNPLLTLYADTEQEIFDIAGIPIMTWATMKLMGFPMSFYEWWFCHQYVVFAELAGHSGLRLLANPPSTFTWILKIFNSELVIEDHDLHHRKGWKKSGNYGKQTRLWDVVFGTCKDRIETKYDNIDWDNAIGMPAF
ncbi:hypothetical protein G3M48_000332 [Beauveria asiatica]|uniref:Fatty acid hydroxylase domain-containing protein n=1 Tax=Beauveria asiatica TaxID=1069075 RepID=A0AAW0RGI7_9HYPO